MLSVKEERLRLESLPDADLIAEHLGGVERASTVLVERYHGRLVGFIMKMIRDDARSEEIAQEVWRRIFRHCHRFDRTKKFTSWMYEIAKNLACNEYRDRDRNRVICEQRLVERYEDMDLEFADPKARTDQLCLNNELSLLLQQAISELDPDRREVFLLREKRGYDYQMIADLTEANLGTVKSRLHRARSAVASHPKVSSYRVA